MSLRDITKAERLKYERVWQNPVYREESPAVRVLPQIRDELGLGRTLKPGASLVDLGCGTGRAAQILADEGYNVWGVDIANNAIEKPRGSFGYQPAALHEFNFFSKVRADAGYCVDVMEHIPEELVMPTLENIAEQVAGSVYFRIAMFGDEWGKAQGYGDLHPTVKDVEWWVSRMCRVWQPGHAVCWWVEDDSHHGNLVLVVVVRK